jgi:hypothetical protein
MRKIATRIPGLFESQRGEEEKHAKVAEKPE